MINVSHLQDEAEAAAFFESVVPSAEIVLVKIYGGAAGLPGFRRLAEMIDRESQWLVAMPATDDLDPELTANSNTGGAIAHEAKAYLQLGGVENFRQCLYFLSDHLLATGIGYDPPSEQPRTGIYHPRVSSGDFDDWLSIAEPLRPTVGLTFYRSYWLAGDTAFIDALTGRGRRGGRPQHVAYLRVFAEGRIRRTGQPQPARRLRSLLRR